MTSPTSTLRHRSPRPARQVAKLWAARQSTSVSAGLKTRLGVEQATGLFRRQVAAEHGLVARSTQLSKRRLAETEFKK